MLRFLALLISMLMGVPLLARPLLSVDVVTAPQEGEIVVPVYLDSDGVPISAYNFALEYNDTDIRLLRVERGEDLPLNFQIASNTTSDGFVASSGFILSGQPFDSSGEIARLVFERRGPSSADAVAQIRFARFHPDDPRPASSLADAEMDIAVDHFRQEGGIKLGSLDFAASMSIGTAEVVAGGAVNIPITLTTPLASSRAVTIRVELDEPEFQVVNVIAGDKLSVTDHQLDYRISQDGQTASLVIHSPTNSGMPGSESILAYLRIRASPGAAVGSRSRIGFQGEGIPIGQSASTVSRGQGLVTHFRFIGMVTISEGEIRDPELWVIN